MIDRVDFLIAVIGIVVSAAGVSYACSVGASRKADRERTAWLEVRLERRFSAVDCRCDRIEAKVDSVIRR